MVEQAKKKSPAVSSESQYLRYEFFRVAEKIGKDKYAYLSEILEDFAINFTSIFRYGI